jgi:hypothetical protein
MRWIDVSALVFLMRPFRCLSCKHRFYRKFWYRPELATSPAIARSILRRASHDEPSPAADSSNQAELELELDDPRSDLMLDFLDNRPDVPGLEFLDDNTRMPPAA